MGVKNYRVKYDYHMHTVYSDGKGTIEDNVRVAYEKGLSGIAISDHGPGHLFYGIDREKIPDMREKIEKLRQMYQEMDIFLAVEANIIHTQNGLDVSKEELACYDFILAGYHFGVKNGYVIQNYIHHISPVPLPGKQRLLKKNTDMMIRAIYENPIKVLTHPGDKGHVDLFEISKACADRGTLMEISARHRNLTIEEIKLTSKTDVRYIVSSDAHTSAIVGSCGPAIKRALDAGLEMSRIVNVEEY